MRSWYLFRYKVNLYQRLIDELAALDVEFFAPTYVELRPRNDRPSFRKKEMLLFPGYLFLRFDPEVVHTTTISEIPGGAGFVTFGTGPCTVPDSLIVGLRHALLLRTDSTVRSIEFRNTPNALVEQLHSIVKIPNVNMRRQALHEALEQQLVLQRMANSALVYSKDRA